MTVCIAGIHEDRDGSSILLVSDRRVSLFGGYFSQDGNAKYRPVHRNWIGMFAGDVEETNLMLKAVTRSLENLKDSSLETVVDQCRFAYMSVRVRLIETQILPEFDIRTYDEFKALELSDEGMYLNIHKKIDSAQENWHLLFAGFDDAGYPHLFVITGPGTVQYCDSQKVAAIGSGDFSALMWLSFYGYHSRKPIGRLLFGLLSAKFFAERARDVGPTTVVSVIRSGLWGLIHFNDNEVADVRSAWDNLPKVSDETVQQLEQRMAITFRVLNEHAQQQANRESEPKK